jgi:hypothetical protein
MNEETNDVLNYDEPVNTKLPTGLNVLTILTFIGCAFELYSTVNNFISGKQSLEKLQESQSKMAEAPAWAKKMVGPEVQEMMIKGYENRIPIFIIGLIAIALCVYGAIEMRKQKKQGFTLWLIGELLPFVSVIIFIGTVYFNTIFVYFSVIPLLFIILYLTQRKHLKY